MLSTLLQLLFQVLVVGLIVLSFGLVIGVPVVCASPQAWDQSKNYVWLISGAWAVLVVLVAGFSFLVV
ncbi:MAG: photosystem II reaction center protein PsbZ [Leptolyngbyaceae cyanobacterium MO_188.B28]|nr:photosystem II reaction center protein PsbZ [Leptolyngbyaceae cyanobacterium MO_188.B28]